MLPLLRQMPGSVSKQTFEIARTDYNSPEVGGAGGAVTAGFPRWAARYTLGVDSPRQTDQWRAFLASLRGAQKLFYAVDFSRPRPAYFAGGLPAGWDGALGGWSQSVSDGEAALTVAGLPSGMGVATGDYVGFSWSTGGAPRFALVRALQDVASSGGSASFPIEPAVPTCVPANAFAFMSNAGCLMRQDTTALSIADMDRSRRIAGTTFSGMQVLLP